MKTALITGGGGAIASEIAIRLDARGYQLILADINEERMATVAATLSRPATCLRIDLSTTEGVNFPISICWSTMQAMWSRATSPISTRPCSTVISIST